MGAFKSKVVKPGSPSVPSPSVDHHHQTADDPLGRRLIPHIIDKNAATQPDAECFQVPRSAEPRDGWEIVSWKQFADAIDTIAHGIVTECGPAPKGEFPTIAYIGPNDARYVAFLVAAVKTGYQAFFISPRNSPAGQIHLLESVGCQIASTPSAMAGMIQPWLTARPSMKVIKIESLESLLSKKNNVEKFPYHRTYDEAKWEPLCTLHSSGTTGMPKPIVVRHGAMGLRDGQQKMDLWRGKRHIFDLLEEKLERLFLPVPLFHAGALYTFIGLNVFQNIPSIFGISGKFPSGDFLTECLENMDVSGASLAPFILESMVKDERAVTQLKKLNLVIYGGGSLNPEAGEKLKAAGVNLFNVIASTEASTPPIYEPAHPDLWNCFHVNPENTGIRWVPQPGEDDVCELVFVRDDSCTHVNQGVFYTFPELSEYSSSDLFRKHPEVPDHWIYQGRADNVIVLSNGEKLNPITIEETVAGSELLTGVLVVGAGRFQAAMLLEPVSYPKDETEAQNLIDKVWPLVVKANKDTVAHGQILKNHIGISTAEKPFQRTAKGTIKRNETTQLYEEEIEQLYRKAKEVSSSGAPQLDVTSEESLIRSILNLFDTRIGSTTLDQNTDFYAAGLDSLQMITAAHLLRGGIDASTLSIDPASIVPSTIYGNPTARRLARHLLASNSSQKEPSLDPTQLMTQMLEKYTKGFTPGPETPRPPPSKTAQTVVITGTTGTLGCYLLHDLVKNPSVARIICLNRDDDGGRKRQPALMALRGLTTDLGPSVAFHRIDISKPDLGLAPSAVETILASADRIIHAAWAVNFNVSIESMEPHVAGTRHVVDLAARCAKRVNVSSTSTAGAFEGWDVATRGPKVPEEVLDDFRLASNGYCQSKALGNLVLARGAVAGGFDATLVRVGQIAGPLGEKGWWNRQELIPSLIASSLELGALPASIGLLNRVDWLPLEVVSRALLELVLVDGSSAEEASQAGRVTVYHCANPSATTFDKMAPAIQEFYGKQRIPELISFGEWIDRLVSRSAADSDAIARLPAVKLIDTLRTLAVPDGEEREAAYLDTTQSAVHSSTLREAGPVTPDLMKHWCKQWKF